MNEWGNEKIIDAMQIFNYLTWHIFLIFSIVSEAIFLIISLCLKENKTGNYNCKYRVICIYKY